MAYKNGVDAAYRAVMRPVEGTILTVARETADRMIFEAKRTGNLETILENTLIYGEKVLEKTPEMLKVLKEAKVVDAGGKGLLFLLMGCFEVIKNPHLEISYLEKDAISSIEEKNL
jgi:dihydroxyacetone kinase-like predicted kinase